eukprot:11910824-Alexandrium_andersonii.AAC.1
MCIRDSAWALDTDATLREVGRAVRTLPPGTGALEAEAAGAALAMCLSVSYTHLRAHETSAHL